MEKKDNFVLLRKKETAIAQKKSFFPALVCFSRFRLVAM